MNNFLESVALSITLFSLSLWTHKLSATLVASIYGALTYFNIRQLKHPPSLPLVFQRKLNQFIFLFLELQGTTLPLSLHRKT